MADKHGGLNDRLENGDRLGRVVDYEKRPAGVNC